MSCKWFQQHRFTDTVELTDMGRVASTVCVANARARITPWFCPLLQEVMQEAYYPMQTDGQQQEQPPPAAPVVGWGVCPHLEWRKGALESTLALYTVRAM